jgi:DNA-binding response OmpR family regulator
VAKILVIDGDGIAREALAVFLVKEGHDVACAGDGVNGLQSFKAAPPDLVLLDRDLPLLPATALLEKIRELSPSVPVVVLTRHASEADAGTMLKAGATRVLPRGEGLHGALAEVDALLGRPRREPLPASPCAPRRAEHPRDRGLVLVADDDASVLQVLTRHLTEAGYRVLGAADGLETERLAHESRPDVILLDIYMPGKDGLALLKHFREHLPATGVLVMTGSDDEDLARDCLRLGAFDYAEKPFKLAALEETIRARILLQRGG